MAVTRVTIKPVTVRSHDVDIPWTTDQPTQATLAYVALNQADLADPAKRMSRGPTQSIRNNFQTTIPDLAVGAAPLRASTQYFCQAEADRVLSAVLSFTTLPEPATLKPTDDHVELGRGDQAEVSVQVLSQGRPQAGIQVDFNIMANSKGSLQIKTPGGPAQSGSATSKGDGMAALTVIGGNPGLVQIQGSSAVALNQVVIPVTVK